jgi:hypothetical protein
VLARALALDPEQRFGSAEEMAAALAACATPTATGHTELITRVASASKSERPLGELERRIMADLDLAAEPSVLIYAPDPSTSRLFVPQSTAHAVGAVTDEHPTAPVPHQVPFDPSGFDRTRPYDGAAKRGRTRLRLVAAAIVVLVTGGMVALIDHRDAIQAAELDLPEAPARVVATQALPERAPRVPVERAHRRAEPERAVALAPAPQPVFEPDVISASAPIRPTARAVRGAVARAPVARPVPARPVAALADRPGGFISLDSEPWATVYLGKRRLGITPFLRVPIPAGENDLVFDVQDSGRQVHKVVEIAPGQLKRLTVQLP